MLLYVGRFTEVKRVALLIEAYARARAGLRPPRAARAARRLPGRVGGRAPARRRSSARARATSSSPAGTATTSCPRSSPPPTSSCCPRVREQFGQVLVEGMACGLPVDRGRRATARRRSSTTARPAGSSSPTTSPGLANALVEAVNRPAERRAPRRARRAAVPRALRLARAGARAWPRSTTRPRSGSPTARPSRRRWARAARRCYLSATVDRAPLRRQGHAHADSRARPSGVGLYDPSLRARRLRRRVRRAAGRRRRRTRRSSARSSRWRTSSTAGPRAPTRTRATARASSCRSPTSSSAGSSATELPPPGAYGVGVLLPAPGPRRAAAELEALLDAHGRGGGPARRRLARRAGGQGLRAASPPSTSAVRQAGGRSPPREDLRRRPGRVRAQALRDPPRGREGRRAGPRDPEPVVAHDRLQGDAHARRSCAATTPTCRTSASQTRAGARALALLDEHVPELGARAPVPDDRPQRRDQHAARQRQLDARARVAARAPSCSATTCEGCCRSCARAARTRRRSTTCSSCSCSAGRSLPHAMMMLVPEAWEGRDDMPEHLKRLLRLPLVLHGAVGRPGGGRVHRRPR